MGCIPSAEREPAHAGRTRVGSTAAVSDTAAAGPPVAASADEARKLQTIRDAVGSLPDVSIEMIRSCLHEQAEDVERTVNVLLDGSYATSLAAANAVPSSAGARRGERAERGAPGGGAAVRWSSHLHIQTGRRYFYDHAAAVSESVWVLPPGAIADAVHDEEIAELADYIDELISDSAASGGGGGGGAPTSAGSGEPPAVVQAIMENLDYGSSVRLVVEQSRRHALALATTDGGGAAESGRAAGGGGGGSRIASAAALASVEVATLRPAERFPSVQIEQLAVDGQHSARFRAGGARDAGAGAGAGAGACTDVCVTLAVTLLHAFAVGGVEQFQQMLSVAGRGVAASALAAGPAPSGAASRGAAETAQQHRLRPRTGADGGRPVSPPVASAAATPPPPFRRLRALVARSVRTGTATYAAQGAFAQMHFVDEALRLARAAGVDGAGGVQKLRADALFNLPVSCDDAQPLSLDAFCATLRDAAERARDAPVCAVVVAERTSWTVLIVIYGGCALVVDPHGAEGQAVVVAIEAGRRRAVDDLVRLTAEATQLVSGRPLYPTFECPPCPRVWLHPDAGQTEVTLLTLKRAGYSC